MSYTGSVGRCLGELRNGLLDSKSSVVHHGELRQRLPSEGRGRSRHPGHAMPVALRVRDKRLSASERRQRDSLSPWPCFAGVSANAAAAVDASDFDAAVRSDSAVHSFSAQIVCGGRLFYNTCRERIFAPELRQHLFPVKLRFHQLRSPQRYGKQRHVEPREQKPRYQSDLKVELWQNNIQ